MITLTLLDGSPVDVNPASIVYMREPKGHEYDNFVDGKWQRGPANTVINFGGQAIAVRETREEVRKKLVEPRTAVPYTFPNYSLTIDSSKKSVVLGSE